MLERWSAAPFRPTDAPDDRPLWNAYHRYRRELAHARAPGEPIESDAVIEHRFLRIRDDMLHHRYAVIEGQQIVSFADIGVARPDSPGFESRRHTLHLDIGVVPEYRRRDIATNWLSLVVEAMNLHGASRLVAAVSEADGHGFARWLGAEVAHVDQEATCDITSIDRARLERWQQRAAERTIQLRVYRGRLLPEQRNAYAALARSLARAMAPNEADRSAPADPLTALDSLQGLLDVAGGRHFVVMAYDDQGRGLGIADAIWTPDASHRADLLSIALRTPSSAELPPPEIEDALSRDAVLDLARGMKASLILNLLDILPELSALRSAHRGADPELLGVDDEIGFQTHRIITTYRLAYEDLVARLEAVGLN